MCTIVSLRRADDAVRCNCHAMASRSNFIPLAATRYSYAQINGPLHGVGSCTVICNARITSCDSSFPALPSETATVLRGLKPKINIIGPD